MCSGFESFGIKSTHRLLFKLIAMYGSYHDQVCTKHYICRYKSNKTHHKDKYVRYVAMYLAICFLYNLTAIKQIEK